MRERLATPLRRPYEGGVIPALALLLLVTGPALAQQAVPARQAAEAERANAAQAAGRVSDAATEARRLAGERIAGAARVQAAERAAYAAANRAEAAGRAEAEARAEQARLSAELAPLLPLLTRLAAQPAPILLAAPLPPAEVALGLAALRAMLREAQHIAEGLRVAEASAAAEARRYAHERRQFSAAEAEARQASVQLDQQLEAARHLLAERSEAERTTAARASAEVTRAQNLEEALARLERGQARRAAIENQRHQEAERRAAALAAAEARRGAIPLPPVVPHAPEPAAPAGLPVAGRLLRGFNSPGDGGPARGLTFAGAPGARVTAPCGGSVAFAAPFRSYGRMVILDCGQGQHLVLAGMERLDVSGGQRIQAGEPVGVLPATGQATLYVELRRGGEAVDPRPMVRSGA